MKQLRDVYKKVRLMDIKKGDVFRMYEGEKPIVDNHGRSEWEAKGDAYLMDNDVWGVDISEEG